MWFYFLIFFALSLLCFFQKTKNNLLYYYFSGLFLILVAGLRNKNICSDYDNYITLYNGIKEKGIYFLVEPTYIFISLITPRIEWLMLIYATISISLILVGIKRLTEFYFFSLLVFFSGYFFLHEMTQIRVGVAAGLLLLCIEPIYNRNIRKFLFISVIAITFHYSALIILPLYFLRTNKINILVFSAIIPIAYLLHLLGIHFSSLLYLFPTENAIQQKLIFHQQSTLMAIETPKINVINIMQLLRIVFIYLLLWKNSLLQHSNEYFIILVKIYVFSIASFLLFADIPVLGFRISELLGIVEIILVPLILYFLRPRIIAYIICFLFAIGNLYMTIIYAELLKPYFG